MVARIAAEPINASVTVSEFRSRAADYAASATAPVVADDPLPPVPVPVPAPVPAPALVTPSQAFAAALIAERLPQQPALSELKLRQNTTWQAPDSDLRLTDRKA